MIHYASDSSENMLDIFNEPNDREFLSNEDYKITGYKNSFIDNKGK